MRRALSTPTKLNQSSKAGSKKDHHPIPDEKESNKTTQSMGEGWGRLLSKLSGSKRADSFDVPQPYPSPKPLRTSQDFGRLGLRGAEAEAFENLAKEKQLDIFVRTGTVTRTMNVGRPGLRPKPAGIYQKTSKDAYLPGLVLYKACEEKKGRSDLATVHNPDPHHAPLSMQVLATEGFHLRPVGDDYLGLRDQAGNFVYGDIDIHGVYARQADGPAIKIPAEQFVPLFNAQLMETGLHGPHLLETNTEMKEKEYGVLPYSPIQHGAHDEWTERNNTKYAGGVNMGPLPGVIHFSPDAPPYSIESVPQYREALKLLKRDEEYVGASWANGRNRLATEHFREKPTL